MQRNKGAAWNEMTDFALRHRLSEAASSLVLRRLLPVAALSFAVLTGYALSQSPRPAQPAPAAQAATADKTAYYEFGTVVSVGDRSIAIQTYDAKKQKNVQHGFVFATDSRADVVRPGDNVAVIYTAGKDWTIRRLMVLNTGIPKAGPPVGDDRAIPDAIGIRVVPSNSAGRVPSAQGGVSGATTAGKPAAGSARDVALPGAAAGSSKAPAAANATITVGAAPKPRATAVIDVPMAGSEAAAGKAASAIDVPLGTPESAMPKVMKATEVKREVPLEECNRSSADWPSQPLRLAVLDFRYPTDREEAHDIGTTGGGSGTAVADLIFAQLDTFNQFAMIRGDRTRLYRADFAGAARTGRDLGADAVLAGTFDPVAPPPGSDPDFPPPKKYELKAGIVDTCTGQLLMRLSSVQCSDGIDPNSSINAGSASCKRFSVTAKEATDPKEQARAFRQSIDALVNPLAHNGPPPGAVGSAGVVIGADSAGVSVKLAPGANVKVGDQVTVHGWGLTKNPTTYTLRNLHDEEIGRVTVSAIQGGIATGTFTGDYAPRAGDTAELISPSP